MTIDYQNGMQQHKYISTSTTPKINNYFSQYKTTNNSLLNLKSQYSNSTKPNIVEQIIATYNIDKTINQDYKKLTPAIQTINSLFDMGFGK